nr:RHS repeat protein [Oceanococcus sp. HetDA_MAG_MS8]
MQVCLSRVSQLALLMLLCLPSALWAQAPTSPLPIYWRYSASGYVLATGLVRDEAGNPVWVEIDESQSDPTQQQQPLPNQPPPDAQVLSGPLVQAALAEYADFVSGDSPYRDAYQILDRAAYNQRAEAGFGTARVQRNGQWVDEPITSPPLSANWVMSVVIRDPATVTDPQALPPEGLVLLQSPIDLGSAPTSIPGDTVSVIVDAQGRLLHSSPLPVGFQTDFFDPPLQTPLDRQRMNAEMDERVLNGLSGVRVRNSLDWNAQALSAPETGGYRLSYLGVPCPCTAFSHDTVITGTVPYRSFNPKSPSGQGIYTIATPQSNTCIGYAHCDLPAPVGSVGGTLGSRVAGIVATLAEPPRLRRDLRLDSVLLSGIGRLTAGVELGPVDYSDQRQSYDPGASFANCAAGEVFATDLDGDGDDDRACLGQTPEQAGRVFVYLGGAPVQAVDSAERPCDPFADGAQCTFINFDLSRAPDTLPDLQSRGLLQRLSEDDLRNTDIYVYRASTGELLAERLGLGDDPERWIFDQADVVQGETAFRYQTLLRGTDVRFRQAFLGLGADKVPDEQEPTRSSLTRGEQLQVVAINRPTGYIGTTTVSYDQQGLQVIVPDLELQPPRLRIRATRKRVDQLGLTQGSEALHLITGEGVGLTDDVYIEIETEWTDADGRPLPQGLAEDGYSGLLYKSVEGDSLTPDAACGADAAQLTIRPGVHKQLLRLNDDCGLQAEHYYLYVCGYPIHRPGRSRCYDFAGPGRPKYYTPVQVPLLDEASTRAQDRAWRALRREGNQIDRPEPVYQWVYRPEFQFSVFDLEVAAINRELPDGDLTNVRDLPLAVLGGTESAVELLYDLQAPGNDEAAPPLAVFGPHAEADRGLLFVLGEEEVPVTLGTDGAIRFENIDHILSLEPADLVTLRLVQNQDPTNILWQFAFKTEGCDIGSYSYQSTDMEVAANPPLALQRQYCTTNLPNRDDEEETEPVQRKSSGVFASSQEFGRGSGHSYALFLRHGALDGSGKTLELVFPRGESIRYERVAGDTVRDSEYTHTQSPGAFFASRLAYSEDLGEFVLTLRDGMQYRFAASDGSKLTTMIDRNGNTVTIERDRGRMLAVRAAHGREITFTHTAAGLISTATDQSGREVRYSYDADGRLEAVDFPDGTGESYRYDDLDRMVQVIDRRGNPAVQNTFDVDGRLSRQVRADNAITRMDYEEAGSGAVASRQTLNARGITTRHRYNTAGYPVARTEALGTPVERTILYERAARSERVTAMTDALGRRTTYAYDTAGNLIQLTLLADTPEAATYRFSYEPSFNQLTQVTNPLGQTTRMAYDEQGNLIEVIDASGRRTRMSHDAEGRIVEVLDGLNHALQMSYSGADLQAVTDALGRTTQMGHDALGRMTHFEDPRGIQTFFTYDPEDRLTQITDALGGITTMDYDNAGNLIGFTDPRQAGTHGFGYDAVDRQITMVDPLNAATQETWAYDNNGNVITRVDRKGQHTSYSYDALDRLTRVVYADGGQVDLVWDAGDRLIELSDSVGGVITRSYDLRDRLVREVTPQGEVRYEYDAANRRTAMELGNGARWEYGYDPAGRLLSVSHPQGAVSYAYDAAGRMTTVNLPNQVIASYSYDAANQITRIAYSRAGVEIGDLSYSYDAAGRRISQGGSLARLGTSGEDFDATYDAANRLITFNGQPLSYDPNGNLLSGLGQSYIWDARDQLSQTADLSFSYDALGRRTQRTDATATTGYLHDGANPIQVDQTLMLSGLGLDAFAAEITPSGTQTYIRDALGSVLAMVDDTGATTGENRYSAYGQTTSTGEASQFAYTGREEDAEDLYFYRARYYSPVLSRFLSEDPIGLLGGSNLYGYVGGDPLRFADPLGLQQTLFGFTQSQAQYYAVMTQINQYNREQAPQKRQFALNYCAAVTGFGALYFPPLGLASFAFSGMAIADKWLTTGEPDYFGAALSLGSVGFVRSVVGLTKAPAAVVDFSDEFAIFLDAGNATRSAVLVLEPSSPLTTESCIDCE